MNRTLKECRSKQNAESSAGGLPRCSFTGNRKPSPFFGWEWLKTPAVLLIVVGMTGLLHLYANEATSWLGWLKFPPLWSCCVLVFCGAILGIITVAAYYARRHRPAVLKARKGWRSL